MRKRMKQVSKKSKTLYIGNAFRRLAKLGARIEVSQEDFDRITSNTDDDDEKFVVKDLRSGRTITIRHCKCGLCDSEYCALHFVGRRPPIKDERILKAA